MTTPDEVKGRHILVVDDEPILRDMIAQDFKRKGFEVSTASNGKEALEIIKAQTIHIVVTDVRMPEGDGKELLEKTRDLHDEIPVVILITGFADMTLEEAYHKGATAVFPKPFARKALFECIQESLQAKATRWAKSAELPPDVQPKTLQLSFSDLSEAMAQRSFRIGRGGFFLGDANPGLEVGTPVQFQFGIGYAGQSVSLKGLGIIRWVRKSNKAGMPPGYGIEFQNLDPTSIQFVVQYLESNSTKTYIPMT